MRSDFTAKEIEPGIFLVTNYAGYHVILNATEYSAFLSGQPEEDTKEYLKSNYFFSEENREIFIGKYAEAVRDYREYLFSPPCLHIFVLTSSCNLNCVYCQASTHAKGEKMSKEDARKFVDIALSSPSGVLSFEFQGGEPLLNFETLRFIVEYAEQNKGTKEIQFNLVSNLIALDEEILAFLVEHKVHISTSLDGDMLTHNLNRPHISGNSYLMWQNRYDQARAVCSETIGAIQTTTRRSLEKYREIVDAYIENGFHSVFLRPLTPLGFAADRWQEIDYTPEEFLSFYRNALTYIIDCNKRGVRLVEGHAVLFLRKILLHRAGNYTELRSPCGAVLGQIAYHYDGGIYTCDEGRMLADMGDPAFRIGTSDSKYEDLVRSPLCKTMATASCLELLPGCSDCVYAPYCGVCPVLCYAESKSVFPQSPNDYKCSIYKGMLDLMFKYLIHGDEDVKRIFYEWVE